MPYGPGFTGPLPVPASVTSLDAAASEVGEVMRVTVFVAKLLTHTDLPVDATAGATASLPGGAIRIGSPTFRPECTSTRAIVPACWWGRERESMANARQRGL